MALPRHIAIIPDGNRRWAREKGFLPWDGHREGMKRYREIADAIFQREIPYFTFWAASEDNLTKRTPAEVQVLASLFKEEAAYALNSERYEKQQIRFRIFGKGREILGDTEIGERIDALEEKTRGYTARHQTILFGYDGRREMLEAVGRLALALPEEVDSDTLHSCLWTRDLPPVDFVIRTGGEPHWSSGFMMWHTANSQLYFTETFWPAFDEVALEKALAEYAQRERRFGT